ncbi:dTDP-4-dehydrorhamnose 3,5-epimerase family protein [Geminicoccaceae bacterium 1502E]|nr:dTDP-4-dehydrorhamnose 3,5-epimerase family protein [Geminicoccaceae bacterium 1502E]
MRLLAEPLEGVRLVALEPRHDARGAFTRLYCREALAALGVAETMLQANLSASPRQGTLRGLHYQLPPSAETKLVTCVGGRIHDVVVDLRRGTPGFCRHASFALDAARPQLLIVPPGCAHGFLTLSADVTVLYLVSAAFDPASERGVRYDDPQFGIRWPALPALVSERDLAHPPFDAAWHLAW